MENVHTKNNISCEGALFGHNYLSNGICSQCRGFQKPLKGMERLELKFKNKSGSARAFLVSEFLDEINKDRDGVKYKKLTPQFLGIKLAHIKKLEDLRWFWDTCNQEDKITKKKKFNVKCFWGKLKNVDK